MARFLKQRIDEKNALIRNYLNEISVNGLVMEKVRTKTALDLLECLITRYSNII